jgi:hypothetical protein
LSNIEKTIRVLDVMLKEGVMSRYAIGGATALLFYMEPALTFDLDVFIFLPRQNSSLFTNLSPIYEYCRKKAYTSKQEHIMIENVAVQFIPTYNNLVEEALIKAKLKKFGTVSVRVFGLEYLMAIMLQTGRAKDWARLIQAKEETDFDEKLLKKLVQKNGLENAWHKFLKK